MSELPPVLSATTRREGDAVVVTCAGCAETSSFDTLAKALAAAHDTALEASVSSVIVDLRDLQFASSSCLKAFVAWLQTIKQLDKDHRYSVRFLTNPRHAWQRRSLTALVTLGAGLVQIETAAAS